MSNTIDVKEFIAHLKSENLIIVSRLDYDKAHNATLSKYQDAIMRRKAITLNEVVQSKLLPARTKQTLRNWITNKTFKPAECFYNSDGTIMVCTSAITRIRKIKGLE